MLNDTHEKLRLTEGVYFDIKEFTLHDGPGARTTVFLKGCPLSCVWCHNPEGMDVTPTLLTRENLCTHCGKCKAPCTHPECKPHGRCLHICPKNLLTVAGTKTTAGALADKLGREADFFRSSEGGVTVSGGEPLRQGEFTSALGILLGEYGIHRALQTSGYSTETVFRQVIAHFDYVLFDLKLASEDEHRIYTGVSNAPIHKNLSVLRASGIPFELRIPLIPNITDTDENLRALSEIAGDDPVVLMPYNPYTGAKYKMTGKEFRYHEGTPTPPDTSIFRNARMV